MEFVQGNRVSSIIVLKTTIRFRKPNALFFQSRINMSSVVRFFETHLIKTNIKQTKENKINKLKTNKQTNKTDYVIIFVCKFVSNTKAFDFPPM